MASLGAPPAPAAGTAEPSSSSRGNPNAAASVFERNNLNLAAAVWAKSMARAAWLLAVVVVAWKLALAGAGTRVWIPEIAWGWCVSGARVDRAVIAVAVEIAGAELVGGDAIDVVVDCDTCAWLVAPVAELFAAPAGCLLRAPAAAARWLRHRRPTRIEIRWMESLS